MYTLYLRIPILQLGCRHVYICVHRPCAQKTPSSVPQGEPGKDITVATSAPSVRVLAF